MIHLRRKALEGFISFWLWWVSPSSTPLATWCWIVIYICTWYYSHNTKMTIMLNKFHHPNYLSTTLTTTLCPFACLNELPIIKLFSFLPTEYVTLIISWKPLWYWRVFCCLYQHNFLRTYFMPSEIKLISIHINQ